MPRAPTKIKISSAKLVIPFISNPKAAVLHDDEPQALPKTVNLGPLPELEHLRGCHFTRKFEGGLSDKKIAVETVADEGKTFNKNVGVTLGRKVSMRYELMNTDDPLSGVSVSASICFIGCQG